MKIIDRYMISELFLPFIIGIAGFVLIMTVDLIFTFVDMIINNGVPMGAVFRLLLFKLPAIMVMTYPVSFLFACALVFSRMSRDMELVALRTSGINFFRICAPAVAAALVVCGIAMFTNETVVPWANQISEGIIRQIIYKQPLPDIREKVFFKDSLNRFYYVNRVDTKKMLMENVMIYELTNSTLPRVITAKLASWKDNVWSLKDGVIHNYDNNGYMDYEADFADMNIIVNENILNYTQPKTPQEMNSKELGSLIGMLKKGGVNTMQLATEFQMKFSIPITTIVFALIGIPLSLPSPRGGRTWGFVLSVVIVFSFYVFASVFRSFGRGGIVSPYIAAWFPPISIAILGCWLIIREGVYK